MSLVKSDRLANKTAIVTGGATLIGQAVVRRLSQEGARILVLDINDGGGEAIAHEMGASTHFLHTDITNDNEVAAAIKFAEEKLDGVSVLVNIACVYDDAGPDSTREQWLNAFNVNVVSAAILANAVRPLIAAQGGGAIVNFTSTSAKVAQIGRWTYPASKAAMTQLTRSMAMDFAADGIRVNSVSPGWTWSAIMDTLTSSNRDKTNAVAGPFHLTNRVGDPGEVAAVVAFLCSNDASVVTGADWAADGGYSAMGPEQAISAIPKLME